MKTKLLLFLALTISVVISSGNENSISNLESSFDKNKTDLSLCVASSNFETNVYRTSQKQTNENAQPLRSLKKFAVNINALGATPLAGVSLDVFLHKNILLEFGVGVPSISGGFKIFATNPIKRSLNFYGGYQLINVGFGGEGSNIHYIPFGLSYIGREGFQVGFDLGPGLEEDTSNSLYLGLKLGFRFGPTL